MHVLQTVSSTEVLFSGITYCVNELSKGLINLEQNVEILSLSSTPKSWVSSQNEYKFRNNFLNIPFLNKSGYSSDMKNYIAASNSNIVHTHGLWMFPNIYRTSNAKFVISPHGMLAENALKFSPIKKKIFYSLFQKQALADAQLFFASAESEFDDIRNYGLKAPIAIIPHGVNIPNIKKAKTYKDKKIAVSIGRLHPKKGLDTLIKTWSRIEPIFSQWDLKIVGPNESGYQIELEKLINKLKLSRVTIEPPKYGFERDLLLSSCDLFVLPSKTENFAMTVAESLAVEIPVIATKATPWSGLQTNRCGWWVEGDEVSLFEQLKVALSLPERQLVDMGQRGKKWMQKDFSWETACKKTLEAYEWIENKGKLPDHIYK
jgi:glycosyltransferase involved in cell wall biosynthesis